MSAGPPVWDRMLEENLRLRGDLAEAHALLRTFASGNYNFARLRFLCEEAEKLLGRAKPIFDPPVNSYADLDERLGVNRAAPAGGAGLSPLNRPIVPHAARKAGECEECKAMGWGE